jgi:hypothetical protein
VDGINILPGSTNATSTESVAKGNIIGYVAWNNSVASGRNATFTHQIFEIIML